MTDAVRPANRPPWKLIIGLTACAFLFGLLLFVVTGWFLYRAYDSQRVHTAITSGDVGRMKELLDREPERLEQRSRSDFTPFLTAAYEGQTTALEELVRRGADVNARWNQVASDDGGWNALHIAARRGRPGVVAALIRAGTDVNARTKQGETPLDIATNSHHERVAELLSGAGGVRGSNR